MASKERGMFRIELDVRNEEFVVEVVTEYLTWSAGLTLKFRSVDEQYFIGYEMTGSDIERFEHHAALLRRLLKSSHRFGAMLETLLKSHDQVVYDGRVSKFVKIDEVLAPEWKAWRDDYYTMRENQYCVWAVAKTAEEAQAEMIALAVRDIAAGNEKSSTEQRKRWLLAGSPVRALDDRANPVVADARELAKAWRTAETKREAEAEERSKKYWEEVEAAEAAAKAEREAQAA